ncbi:MAG: TIGR02147 family protein [Pseudobdellovibrionaceae bacterium]
MKILFPSQRLIHAENDAHFLKVFYEVNKEQSSRFSYAFLAKRCGFASKSFISEVISGKKQLSTQSALKIASGLNFTQSWSKYFLLLVQQNQVPLENASKIRREIYQLKTRLQKHESIKLTQLGDVFFDMKLWPYVYAALGDEKKGATLEQVQMRTGIEPKIILSILDVLIEKKVVVKNKNTYLACNVSLLFKGQKSNSHFQKFFLENLSKLYDKATKNFESETALYLSMAISIDSKKMSEFKKSLSTLLDEYTTDIERSDGDRVAVMTCGFHLI